VTFSATPLLAIVLVALIAITTRRIRQEGHLQPGGAQAIYLLLAVLIAWGALTSTLAIRGVYASPGFLSLLPGLWLPFVPFILAIGGIAVFSRLRSAVRIVVDHTPWSRLVYVHAMRVLALGTIGKAIAGTFPMYFALLVGVPDLLFGVSAFLVGRQVSDHSLSRAFFIAWNLIGVAVVLPAAPLGQMGLPGPLHVFTAEPTAERLFVFPMVLAPSLIVPMFVLMNIATAWRLIERPDGGPPASEFGSSAGGADGDTT
jgi:hypothetical protein